MVQEKFAVQLAVGERGRLRQMIRAGRSSAQAITSSLSEKQCSIRQSS